MNGVSASNYAGVNAAVLNPASLANNLIAFSFEPIMVNLDMDQNIFTTQGNIFDILQDKNILNKYNTFFNILIPIEKKLPLRSSYTYDSLKQNLFSSFNVSHNNMNAYIYNEIRGPSVMFSIGQNTGVALTSSLINIFNGLDNFNGNVLGYLDDIAQKDSLKSDFLFHEYTLNNIKMAVHQYMQIGVHVGTVLYNKNSHLIKGGISVKRLIGILNHSLVGENVSIDIDEISNRSYLGISGQLEFQSYNFEHEIYNFSKTTNGTISYFKDAIIGNNNRPSGWGFDLGLEYEYRPTNSITKYEQAWNNYPEDYSKKHYLYKASLSLLDWGDIRYTASSKNDGLRYLYFSTPFAQKYYINEESFFSEITSIDDTSKLSLYTIGLDYKDSVIEGYTMTLPTRLLGQFDINITNHIYIQSSFMLNLVRKAIHSGRIYSYMSLTPRYESLYFDFGIPLVYTPSTNHIKIGLGFRLGPLVLGSDNISFLFSNFTGLNFYSGIRFALNKSTPKRYSKPKNPYRVYPKTTHQVIKNKVPSRLSNIRQALKISKKKKPKSIKTEPKLIKKKLKPTLPNTD